MIRRIAAAALTLAVAALLLVSAWPQLFGLQRTPLVAHIVSLRGLAACAAVALLALLVVLALVSRRSRRMTGSLGVLLLAFVLVNAAVLSTRGFGDTPFEAKAASDITVLEWNTLGPATTPEAIAELALKYEADVVVLPETILANATQVALLMRAGGRPMWAHTLAYDQISPARSTSLLTSAELGEYDYDSAAKTTAVLPTVVATPRNGSGPTIVAVHAVAPIPDQFANWPADLELLANICVGDNIIMAGDFNATVDHMSGLGSGPGAALGDCVDAAAASKNAALGTWPSMLPALLGAPIDHVMATPDWSVTGMEVIQTLNGSGSDHRPIVVQLSRRG